MGDPRVKHPRLTPSSTSTVVMLMLAFLTMAASACGSVDEPAQRPTEPLPVVTEGTPFVPAPKQIPAHPIVPTPTPDPTSPALIPLESSVGDAILPTVTTEEVPVSLSTPTSMPVTVPTPAPATASTAASTPMARATPATASTPGPASTLAPRPTPTTTLTPEPLLACYTMPDGSELCRPRATPQPTPQYPELGPLSIPAQLSEEALRRHSEGDRSIGDLEIPNVFIKIFVNPGASTRPVLEYLQDNGLRPLDFSREQFDASLRDYTAGIYGDDRANGAVWAVVPAHLLGPLLKVDNVNLVDDGRVHYMAPGMEFYAGNWQDR